jgi:glycosyltransferase involved in cell wall biosynthesis
MQMHKYKISVIIPVYNSEKTISRILNKLITQKYKNIEVIAVNDGSKDASLSILNEYKKIDKRVVVIDQKNVGASAARNVGLKIATGDYLAFIDSDDDISKDLISELAKHIQGNTDFVMCGMTINKKVVVAPAVYIETPKDITKYVLRSLLGKNLLYGPCCKLFKTSIIRDNKIRFPEDVKYGEDTIFVLTYLRLAKSMAVVGRALYSYNFHSAGLASQNSSNISFRRARAHALALFTDVKVVSFDSLVYYLLKMRWGLSFVKSVLWSKYV